MEKTHIIFRFILICIFSTNVTFGSEKKESQSINNVSSLNDNSNLINLIRADAELKVHYNTCLEQGGNWTSCLWEKVAKNENLKKKVQTAAEEDRKSSAIASKLENSNTDETKGSRSPASSPSNSSKNFKSIVAKDNTVKIDNAKDPFILKLQENIEKQLDAIFTTTPSETFKDSNGQVISQAASRNFLATDHSKFATLYNTHLSNSVVQSMSTFCSEAEYKNQKFFMYKGQKERTQSLEKNIALLKSAKFKSPPPEYKKYCVDEKTKNASECAKYNPCDQNGQYYDETSCRFNGCIPVVSKLCYDVAKNTPDIDNDFTKDDQAYTQTRACEVMEFIKSARAAIIALEKQEKFYKENTEKNVTSINMKGLKEFKSEGEISRNSQDIVTITSKIAKDADENSKEEIEDLNCLDKDGNISNQSACDKLVIADKEKAQSAVAELSLRRQVQLDKINELTTIEQLTEFLIAEGETKESAETYIEKIKKEDTSGRALEDILREKITKKYKTETDAIVKGLADKVNAESVDSKDSKDQKVEKYKKIQEELKSKGQRYTNMLHFGNVVSAYLTLTDSKTGESSANANQLYRELASRKDIEDIKTIEENAGKAGLSASKEDTSATTLDIKQINDDILQKND